MTMLNNSNTKVGDAVIGKYFRVEEPFGPDQKAVDGGEKRIF